MKIGRLVLAILLIAVFMVFAMGSGESEGGSGDQGSGSVAEKNEASNDQLGKYTVVIDSCRLAKDYEDKPVVIVKYIFTNVSDENAVSFMVTFDDAVFQNGVGLNSAIILDDDVKFDSDNQMKEIKKGASLEVEVAYELNDTTTDVEVEVKELFSFSDKTLKKTFKIAE